MSHYLSVIVTMMIVPSTYTDTPILRLLTQKLPQPRSRKNLQRLGLR